jgi:class 3 adenylate cyclase
MRTCAKIGLHTGEFFAAENMAGNATLVATEVLQRAGWDQVLATGTLRDLVAGSGIRFGAVGRLEVCGLGEWQLLEVL